MNNIVSEWSYPNDEPNGIMKLRIMVFSVLTEIAFPVVENFRSDLYHDVHWIDEHVNGPTFFNYSVDDYGTCIGNEEYVLNFRKYGYKVFITGDRGEFTTEWKIVATPINVPDEPDVVAGNLVAGWVAEGKVALSPDGEVLDT